MIGAASTPDDLQQAMETSKQRWDNAQFDWFDYLADDAIVYSIGHTEPYVGKQAYENRFGPILTRAKRSTTVVTQTVQMMGESAIVAQTLQIEEGAVVANVRQSVVWTHDAEGTPSWKIQHLHTALIGQPNATQMPASASGIRVLNERIATVAAVLGVAQ
jgi:SnoaL-like domain